MKVKKLIEILSNIKVFHPDNDVVILDLDDRVNKFPKDFDSDDIKVLKIRTADSDINATGPWDFHKAMIRIGSKEAREECQKTVWDWR